MNMTRQRFAKRAAAVLVVAAIAILPGRAAQAQVLDQVPSDALVVIKIGNLKAVSDKVAKFAEAVGLAAVSPEFANPLASMQEHMKIKNGLDTSGEVAILMLKPADKEKDAGEEN